MGLPEVASVAPLAFTPRPWLSTTTLARTIDSLVRVSRRVGEPDRWGGVGVDYSNSAPPTHASSPSPDAHDPTLQRNDHTPAETRSPDAYPHAPAPHRTPPPA